MFNLDFNSTELQFPCHSRYEKEAQRIKEELSYLKDHFLIFSSGTTSRDLKGYALSRRALLANAQAVNEHFNLTKNDIWGLSLPYYHVGGLSVLARAFLLGSNPVDLGLWNPQNWVNKLESENITITTLVPTQVFDLVQSQIASPPKLKYVIIGGDYLGHELEKRAFELGWPIVRTFGMTEVCSQLASAKKPGESLEILPIHTTKIEDGRLLIKSETLFTLQFKLKDKLETLQSIEFCDSNGFYLTNDLAEQKGNNLYPLGRIDDQIKIAGKLVSINSLKETLYAFALEQNFYGKIELIIESDERIGKHLVILKLPEIPEVPQELFSPLKFSTRIVSSFERTDLGKLKAIRCGNR